MDDLGPEDPRMVGCYVIEGRLGEGGMGRVYRGRSPGGRTVAVKVARPHLATDPGFRLRFHSEVEAARRVGGFHTAQVVDANAEAEPPWMVTAFIPGRSLDRVIAEDGPMGAGELRALGAALAEALQAIHACGLVHRDLKPSNIIMSEDGPRVLDFGIARALEETRITSTDQVVGTPGFLAPEQVARGPVGPACDVFALGAVLICAAGGRAFGEGAPVALMYRITHDDPDLSALAPELRPVVARCLQRNPMRRISPGELLAALNPGTQTGNAPARDNDPTPTPKHLNEAGPTHPSTVQDNAPAGHAERQQGPGNAPEAPTSRTPPLPPPGERRMREPARPPETQPAADTPSYEQPYSAYAGCGCFMAVLLAVGILGLEAGFRKDDNKLLVYSLILTVPSAPYLLALTISGVLSLIRRKKGGR